MQARQPPPATSAICRALDVLIASAGLMLSLPVLLLAAIAVRLESRGPAIFRQRRLGLHHRPFTVYKLRTLRHDADSAVHREYVNALIRGRAGRRSDGRRSLYKLASDDRVTRVGGVLRRSSIDEIPQLVNVLRGEMSIVGPRPVIAYERDAYPPGYDRRFDVKPGLTGLWQVSGRNERSYHEMLELDIAWTERISVRLYLSILARTPAALLRGSGVA